jgi:hypothetical protein
MKHYIKSILFFSLFGLIPNISFASKNLCVGNNIKNVKIYIFKPSYFDKFTDGSFKGFEDRKLLQEESINLNYIKNENVFFSEGIESLKDEIINAKNPDETIPQQKYNWNMLSVSYTLDNNFCVISFPFNLNKDDYYSKTKNIYYINGIPYQSPKSYSKYMVFYDLLIKTGYLPKDFLIDY